MPTQLVWFKRDLRVHDHAPLAAAARRGPVLAAYVYEPAVYGAADCAPQHVAFVNECLAELRDALARRGVVLLLLHGDLPAAFDRLLAAQPFAALWSHEETGNAVTYARDRAVARWCRERGVPWRELPQNGVVRALPSRDGWAKRWEARMAEPLTPAPARIEAPAPAVPAGRLLTPAELGMAGADKARRQRGGRAAAERTLAEFLEARAAGYRGGISSPLSAVSACSRLSPYLAHGALSMREVVHATRARCAELRAAPAAARPRNLLASLAAFEGRLHWHCHFMQKLESEPAIEFENLHRGYDGLREDGFDPGLFAAWREGRTGFPLVDACMRMLAATGWLNFRMRAMVTSFAAYLLWLHWREPALHLAREFLDYEPGIHYPQVQMQSGVTGINALRIYNPVKQARDHDPEGVFVRRWCPELAQLRSPWIFEPWAMPPAAQRRSGCVIGRDYPAPAVDFARAYAAARERMEARRRTLRGSPETGAVAQKHASRRRPRRARAGQLPLALDQ